MKHISAAERQKAKNPHGFCDWLFNQNPFVLHTLPYPDKLPDVPVKDAAQILTVGNRPKTMQPPS